MMIIRMFAAEVLAGHITIEQVPIRLRKAVEDYIASLEKLNP